MSESIGQRIRKKREEKEMTQSQVAERLYVTQQTVARWESDKHVPPVKAVQDLAKLFNVDAAYFFGEDRIVARHFNFFAFLGSLLFNVLFFWIPAVLLVSLQLTLWCSVGACLVAPGAVIWQAIAGIKAFTITRMVFSLVMLGGAILVVPILWKITKYLGRILRAYYRYNIDAIVYEVVPKSHDDHA
ncbi:MULTISPECIES: helix-turn-helix domain-containing protein [Lacticaseibacillus]|uniref:helix-turn-helix domain-containing protein n=1 Tax=Lacticaseibacillus TaxID=2759736 RepID=UPI00063DC9AC|nr:MULTISPECIES: helix-turn-helix domain-containing protein [Lacticaseibacillus]KLI76774.1 XRE family transcriptional regulator [Lacticaseibacillus casei]